MSYTSPLVSTNWLSERLDQPNVKIVDGSWYLKTMERDPEAEYAAGHIPGAVRFDIDIVADTTSHLPHMLASPSEFAAAVGAMGISEDDTIVVYDGSGLFSAARVWWNFRTMGAANTFVLSGGLPKWVAEARQLSQEAPKPEPVTFTPNMRSEFVANIEYVLAVLEMQDSYQIVDVRAPARFSGEAPEPREGMRKGHMPGARNLPFASLIEDGALKDDAELRALIADAGIDLEKPIVASCGSGVTASVFALTAAQLGVDPIRVYDGSWTEWGADKRVPIEEGPAKA